MEETKLKTLKNGAVYDMERHRIVANPGGGLAAFNSDTARQAQARRQEQKRLAVAAAANAAVERGEYRALYGDMAYVAAITEAQYIKATTPDDAKSTDAARFIFQESGVAESLSAGSDGAAVGGASAVPGVVVLLLAELAKRADAAEVIDAAVVGDGEASP